MIYKKWNNTKYEFDTSLLGFGCMRFPTLENGEIDEVHSQKMIDYGIENGVNYIDTAWFYHGGKSEEFVGKALEKYKREDYQLATKFPVWEVTTKEEAVELFNTQLKRLKTTYFDTYLIHALDKTKWDKVKSLDVMSFFEEKVNEGVIKSLGFSFHSDLDDFKYIVKDYPWEFCQIQLNYMDIDHQQGIEGLRILEDMNIPVIIMEPLKGGSLANIPDVVAAASGLNDLGMTQPEAALKWFYQFDSVITILSGMSSFEHVKENVETLSNQYIPTSDFVNAIDKTREELLARTKVNCTSCDYCMPCPKGVNIPSNFGKYNEYGMYDNASSFIRSYSSLSDEQKADNCVSCGVCEEKCPQHIEIAKELGLLSEDIKRLKKM